MIKRLAFRTASRLVLQPWHRQVRGMTLGTRSVAIREGRDVLLVRHTYAPGWLLPGGGVERGETVYDAAVRELREEAAIVAEGAPELMGLFLNDENFPGDHVACFVVRSFRQEAFTANAEIAEARFFNRGQLPEGTSGGTRRRIAEAFGAPRSDWRW